MSAEIIPFDFEEQAVRVVMRGEDPWFVAADVCRCQISHWPTRRIRGVQSMVFSMRYLPFCVMRTAQQERLRRLQRGHVSKNSRAGRH